MTTTDGEVALPIRYTSVPKAEVRDGRDVIRVAEGTLVKLMDAVMPPEGSKVPITATIATVVGAALLAASFVLAALPNFIGLTTVEFLAGVICGLALSLVGPTFEHIDQRQRINGLATGSAAVANLKREVGESAVRLQP